jgi:four helix bundle protein
MGSFGYKDLKVWQNSMDIAEQVYLLTQSFPKQETFDSFKHSRRSH